MAKTWLPLNFLLQSPDVFRCHVEPQHTCTLVVYFGSFALLASRRVARDGLYFSTTNIRNLPSRHVKAVGAE